MAAGERAVTEERKGLPILAFADAAAFAVPVRAAQEERRREIQSRYAQPHSPAAPAPATPPR